jgi:Ca2+-binding RTX toxin-like protein
VVDLALNRVEETVTVDFTVGPGTVFSGLDRLQLLFIPAGTQNFNDNLHTEYFVDVIEQTTETFRTAEEYRLTGRVGTLRIVCEGHRPTIVGTPDAEVLLGTPGNDVIHARKGDDEIDGLGGDDTICGGGGKDVLRGGEGDDEMHGGTGSDTLLGEEGDDTLNGGPTLTDVCEGGPGRNVFSPECE